MNPTSPYSRLDSDSTTSILPRRRLGLSVDTSVRPFSIHTLNSAKFSLSPDPHDWGATIYHDEREADDHLHNPDPRRDRKNDQDGDFLTGRGLANLGCLAVLLVVLLAVFAGYPVASHFIKPAKATLGDGGYVAINATGQVPSMSGQARGVIDTDTPQEAYTFKAFRDGSKMELVFSDEFNVPGRTFWPGDDPYWEAANLHYWQTDDLEYYSPEAITTRNGSLQITLSKQVQHKLNYTGGMMTTWFCFTGGLVLASVNLPGANNVLGLWPAIWTMGNLGRAGYGASLEGMWPYTYDSCDVGTAPNQTVNGLPVAATVDGDPSNGESHPGPIHKDGTYVGRSAPEIDIFEAQITDSVGYVSQSCQWAPFDAQYMWQNTSANLIIYNSSITTSNPYLGGAYQQATSSVTQTVQECYQLNGTCFATYGMEYKPGFDDAYITWINNGEAAWTLNVAGMGADSQAEISARPVPQEPMYLIVNLGLSESFEYIDFDHLQFPAVMSIDWIRVYQRSDSINVGCDPSSFPTAAYINTYKEAYSNPNLTTWHDDYKQPYPKSSLLGQCD